MKHVALEGRCFVISANHYLLRSDLPDDVHPVQGDDPDTILINGGSTIISPMGEVIAGPLRETEGVLLAEIDTSDIAAAKFDFDPAGHYTRSDIFSLRIDAAPKGNVVTPADEKTGR